MRAIVDQYLAKMDEVRDMGPGKKSGPGFIAAVRELAALEQRLRAGADDSTPGLVMGRLEAYVRHQIARTDVDFSRVRVDLATIDDIPESVRSLATGVLAGDAHHAAPVLEKLLVDLRRAASEAGGLVLDEVDVAALARLAQGPATSLPPEIGAWLSAFAGKVLRAHGVER